MPLSPQPDIKLSRQLGELTDAASALVRSELRLAKAEVGESVRSAGKGIVDCVVGVLLLHVGILALAGAAIAGLSLVWPVWLAALAVGGAATILGALFVWFGRGRLSRLTPRRTLDEAAATLDLIKEHRS